MARSRNIKPGFFCNEDLVEFDFATRLLFIGLWTIADRDGRLEDRPKKIKINVFPADDVDVVSMMDKLAAKKFITRYEINGEKYVQIVNWSKHQNPHHTEKDSTIPDIHGALTVKQPLEPRQSPKKNGGNPADILIPDSLIPDSPIPDTRSKPKPAIACPPDVDQQTWDDWLALRKAKKAPVTQTVIDGAKREAAKAGMTLETFFQVWCRRGSQGLEAAWLTNNEKTFRERDAEANRRRWEEITGQKHPDNAPTFEVLDDFLRLE